MIHSGSRNIGSRVADEYHKEAVAQCEKWHSKLPTYELAFLPTDSEMGKKYLFDMNWCIQFAYASRYHMMQVAIKTLGEVLDNVIDSDAVYHLDVAHNYARMENHFGKNVMVHRKGATSARLNEDGIIPGSQGTFSYIVVGLGNPESFESCSHGAGRKLSRTKAQATLSLEDEIRKMDEAGIVHGLRNKSDLDEAAGAYKDITTVMANQSDLVSIKHTLSPLGSIKG